MSLVWHSTVCLVFVVLEYSEVYKDPPPALQIPNHTTNHTWFFNILLYINKTYKCKWLTIINSTLQVEEECEDELFYQ